MKKGKIILIIALVAVLGAIGYGYYLYNKPAKKISEENPELVVAATKLISDFSANAEKLTTEYVGKVVQVKGKVSMIENGNESKIVIIDNGIKCEFNNLETTLNKDQEITVKGLFTGYDDMFNELSLAKCHIVQ